MTEPQVSTVRAQNSSALHCVTRFAASKPNLALFCAFVATAALLYVLRGISDCGAKTPLTLDRAPVSVLGNSREEAYFAASSEDAETTRRALERIAAAIEERSDSLELAAWGLDLESLVDKRLYAVEESDAFELAYDITTAREISAGRWDYLATDAVIRRFDERMRSELTQERACAVEQALPFVRALAAITDELGMKKHAEIGSPVAPGIVERAKTLAVKRYRLSKDGLSGVVCARLVGGEREAANELIKIAFDAKSAEPAVTIDLDALCVERASQIQASRAAWTRAAIFALAISFFAAWIILGTFKRGLVAALCGASAAIWSAAISRICCEPFSVAQGCAALCAFAFAYYWSVSRIALYAARRSCGALVVESVLAASEEQSGRMLFAAATTSLVALAALLTPWGAARAFGLAACASLLAAAFVGQLFVSALVLFFEEDGQASCATPLRVDAWGRSFLQSRVAFSALVVAGACLAYGCYRAQFDDELYASIPNLTQGSNVVELRGDRIAEISGKRALYALSLTPDEEEIERLKSRYAEENTFRVDYLAARLPETSISKDRAIELVGDMTRNLPLQLGEAQIPEQASLVDALTRAIDSVDHCECVCLDEEKRVALLERLLVAEARIESMAPNEYRARLDAFQAWTSVETLKRLFALRALANPNKPTLDDLSDDLRARYFASENAKHGALLVYSTADLRRRQALEAFVANVRAIDPDAYGSALQRCDDLKTARRWGSLGLVVAFVALLAVLVRRVRSQRDAIRALIPCGFALLAAFGGSGWLGTPLEEYGAIACFAVGVVAYAIAVERAEDEQDRATARVDAEIATALVFLAVGFGWASCGLSGWARAGQTLALAALGLCLANAVVAKRDSELEENETEERR